MATRGDLRSIRMVVRAIESTEGGGFHVRRPFPARALDHVDPFLLVDEMGPSEYGPREAKGAPDHPHRGFETVTYLLSGEMVHRDSHGHWGRLGPGDVQWMTAGAGVVHSEMPGALLLAEGGRMHGFQIWVNLPAREKRVRPRYQDVRAEQIPIGRTADGLATARVVAGEALGASAATQTHTPILFLHVSVASGGRVVQPVPDGWNALAYVFDGAARVGAGEQPLRSGELAVFQAAGGPVLLASDAAAGQAEILLLAGEPIREPIARYGPFVMNTEEEIREAIRDYRAGRMGEIAPDVGPPAP
jgi:hypothetical protein